MSDILRRIEQLREWKAPRRATHRDGPCPFLLSCTLSEETASEDELREMSIDQGLRAFWRQTRSADLFKDVRYGQWGVQILPPDQALQVTDLEGSERPDQFLPTDLVIGKFYGDAELLLADGSRCKNGETPILVVLPLYTRSSWPEAARSFEGFLDLFTAAQGDKYWEVPARS